jgi:carbonic anhydrase
MPFCTVISCMDGRIQRPMMDYLASKHGYDLPDTITDPGLVKALADVSDTAYLARICECIDISVYKHGSRHIFITGHHDCAGNPVSRDVQIGQLNTASQRIKAKYPECQVNTVYINEQWQCEALSVTQH